MTFSSVYEITSPLTTVAKQRFVDYFSGSAIDTTKWTNVNHSGTGTFTMEDAIDGGFSITVASGGSNSSIYFNDKRHYDVSQCSYVTVWKCDIVAGNIVYAGLLNTATSGASAVYQEMAAGDGFSHFDAVSNGTQTEGTVLNDTNYHVFKCDSTPTNAKFYIDGVLDVTKTANTSAKAQPVFRVRTSSLGDRKGIIRYFEAYNT